MMTANNLTTIRPRLPHHILITKSVDEVLPWYCNVLGMSLVHRTDSVEGDQGDSQLLKAAWLTNDKTDHRIVLLEVPDTAPNPDHEDIDEVRHPQPQHFVFIYLNLEELLDTYTRLKEQGVLPTLCTDAIEKTVLYYQDPDNNSVELKVDHREDDRKSDQRLRQSPAIMDEWTGRHVRPDQLIFVREVGVALASVGGRVPFPGNLN
ncbi:MAG TPA: VOC family protein [Granulicella sp.]|jgi:catechol 2,3-dioxygenase-like lactoylglutathione lyase family enzyme